MRRTPMRRRWRSTGPDEQTRHAVGSRAGWVCEVCGGRTCSNLDPQYHHRRPRAMGGSRKQDTNSPPNFLYAGGLCHRTVESRRAEALAHGWLVSQYDDPADVPVLLRYDRWVYLTPAGTYSDHPPEEESTDDRA
jgi:5-methylcytosine-specific restriction protein A